MSERVLLNPDKRFWLKVHPRGDCWEWRGCRNAKGYGMFFFCGVGFRAHRYAFELLRGPIPRDLQCDHLCNHAWCVKPTHIVLTTLRENILRGNCVSAKNARKTHCKHGHLFDEANTWLHRGERSCRTCSRLRGACPPPPERDDDADDEPTVGVDICHHGVGFDERCAECEAETEFDE